MNDKYFSRDNLELVIDGLKVSLEPDKPDWNQNDKSATDYIENKPFYSEYCVIVDNYSGKGSSPKCNFVSGNAYDVIWNGVLYKGLICHTVDGYNCIGGDGYPFYIDDDGGNGFFVNPESGFTVSILCDVVHQLDEKYIPDSITRAEDVEKVFGEIYALKMDAENPVGTGSFSMNRKSGTSVGKYSVATGDNTTASGYASHAEGHYTTASGIYGAHAEGDGTTASGVYSHAEGTGTTASGYASHAEGCYTTASGENSHVQGKYNIEDTENKYAHIVGNGTSDTERSNAHTLDWNGVGWFQGGLQVGGNAQDDGAKNVLLEGDAIPVPVSATVGQTVVVKAVDENGKPTEWEAVDPFVLTDENTGAKYKLSIVDGKLTMTEVTA